MSEVSLIKLANAIDFLSEDSELLQHCFESNSIPDEDTLGLMNNKIREINEHWQKFVIDNKLQEAAGFDMVEAEAEDAARRTLVESDKLPRILSYKNMGFVPVLYKHEWEFHDNAYWAFYARRTTMGFSYKSVLFAVQGTTLANALYKFYKRFDELSVDKVIRGKEWFGPQPFAIDFWNDKM